MSPDGTAVDDDLHFEILKSERLRLRALMFVMGALFLASLVMSALPRAWDPLSALFPSGFPFGALAGFYGAAFLYELFAQALIGRIIDARRRLPAPPRFANALIETSFPTIVMIVLSHRIAPEAALNSPLPMVYFVFISLSTLRLTASLSIFTGCVAGFEFALLGWYLGAGASADASFFNSPWPIMAKAAVMIVTGCVCGFVGAQIRRRLVASLASLDEKNRVIGMFGQYVSHAVVRELLSRPLEDRGDVRHVTIMFLDIRGFTAFAERRSPQEVVDYLNTLFGVMITLVNEHNGIINKFLGDGFMACFGAPLSDGRDVENAVRAAIAIARAVERMNAEGVIAPTRIGIGVHAGEAVTGSVGSPERREYTIIGDTVNLASRVEQLTKHYGCVLLVTDSVWQVVKAEYAGRPLDPVTVRGREEPVAIYSLL